MMNQAGYAAVGIIMVAFVVVAGLKLYRSLNEEDQVKVCVMLLLAGSLTALSTILLMKPVAMVTVVGSLMDTSNDYILLPVVIFVVAVINLVNGRIKKNA